MSHQCCGVSHLRGMMPLLPWYLQYQMSGWLSSVTAIHEASYQKTPAAIWRQSLHGRILLLASASLQITHCGSGAFSGAMNEKPNLGRHTSHFENRCFI